MAQQMFTRRRLLAGAGAIAVTAAGLSACDGRPNTTGERGGDGGSAELTFLLIGPSPDLLSLFKDELIPEFTKQTGSTVTLQTSDWGSAFQKITTSAASHTLPDLLMVGGIWTAPLVAKNALMPLDDHLTNWSDKDQFYPSMLEDASYRGKQYAMPIYADVRTVAYRSDYFTEAGLDPDQPPTTWDEYKEFADKLVKRKGKEITRQGADWSLDTSIGLQQAFAQLMLQAGGTYYTDDGKGNFSSDAGEKALRYLVSFYEDGISSVNFVHKSTAPAPLVAGSTAMQFTNVGVLQNAKANDQGVVAKIAAGDPLKVDASAQPITTGWVNKFAISADSVQPDAAWDWLEFLTKKDNLEQLNAQFGMLPPRKDLADAEYLTDVPRGFLDAPNYMVPQPPNEHMLEIAQVINKALQGAIRGDTGIAETLESIDKQIDDLVQP